MLLSPFKPLPHRLDRSRFAPPPRGERARSPVIDPRRRLIVPHRRAVLPARNMAIDGTTQRDSLTGSLYRDDAVTGGARRNAWLDKNGCCCKNSPCPCGSSGGTLAGTLRVSISGVTVPTACLVRQWSDSFPPSPYGGTYAVFSSTAAQYGTVSLDGTYCITLNDQCFGSVPFPGAYDQWEGGFSVSYETGTFGTEVPNYLGVLQQAQAPHYCYPPSCGCTDGVHVVHATSGTLLAWTAAVTDPTTGAVTGYSVMLAAYFCLNPNYHKPGMGELGMIFYTGTNGGSGSGGSIPILPCGGSVTLNNTAQWCPSGREYDLGCTWNDYGGSAVVTDVSCT